MKDMFYKYDYCADNKEYLKPVAPELSNILDNENPNAQIIKNAFGNEIGVKANKNSTFSLYFNLFGDTDVYTMGELIRNNKVLFEIIQPKVGIIYKKEVQDNYEDECIEIALDSTEIDLAYGTYTMRLTLFFENEAYSLFSESDGYLVIM